MKKMKKKIKKVESDAVRNKQQQQREQVADDVVDRHSNQFPNFMALTMEEKLTFFESLHAARKIVLDSGNKIKERFGTIHDEYLNYFGSMEEAEGSKSFKDSSETLECVPTYGSCNSSLQSESSRSTNSAIPRRTMTKPVETIFIHMNMTNSSTPSITSSKHYQESKSLLSKEDEGRREGENSRNNSTQLNQTQRKSSKRKRSRDDNSDKVKKKSCSRFVTKLPKLKKGESSKAQKEERTLETSTSNKSQFKDFKSDEKEIHFISTLKEAQDNTLKVNPDKDNEILSINKILKYEKAKEANTTKIKVPCRKETYIKGKTNNLRVKVFITSSETERIKKERVSKRKERSIKPEKERMEVEKEKTKKGTGVRVEKDKTSKDTKRKLVRSTDGLRKKQQRQDNSIVTTKKPKENKKENVRTKKKGDSMKEPEEAYQNKRNEEKGKVLVKGEKSMIRNFSGKQEKKKILVLRRKIQKDKPKEKTEKAKKRERSPKREEVEQDRESVLVEEEKQEEKVAKEVKKDSRSSEKGIAEAIGPLTKTAETLKTEAKPVESFFLADKFKSTEDVKDEGKDKTEENKNRRNQTEDSVPSKSFQSEFGEKVKCLKLENVVHQDSTLPVGTTGEEIRMEVEEKISVTKRLLPVKSEVRYQPEQIEPDGKRKRQTEKSKSLVLELRLEGLECLDDCSARKTNSHLVVSDQDSVLQLWEELKLLKLSDSDCVMKTRSMTAQMGNGNISESRFTFLSEKNFRNKVQLAEENLILVGTENRTQEKKGERREAAVLDLLKSEGVIVVDGDAIEKIKNLVKALEKEAETEGDTRLDVKPDKKNLKNEYSQLLLEYIDYLTRLLYMLTNKTDQKPKALVHTPLTVVGSHSEYLQNKNKKSEFIDKPRSLSDTNLPEGTKTEVKLRAKESTLQGSEVEGDPRYMLPFSDSPITVSSCEEDVYLSTTPDTRKKLIEDFLKERTKFVEESIEGFRIIKMAPQGCEVDTKVRDQETGQNRTKFKFFHILSRFCKCVKKKGSEEDQVQGRQQRPGGR